MSFIGLTQGHGVWGKHEERKMWSELQMRHNTELLIQSLKVYSQNGDPCHNTFFDNQNTIRKDIQNLSRLEAYLLCYAHF